MDIQSYVDGFFTILKANFGQIVISLSTIAAASLAAYVTSNQNAIKRREVDLTERKQSREAEMLENTKTRELDLSENQMIIKRQEALFERSDRMVAMLEARLERQAKEQSEEREAYKTEIRGFRRQIIKLERRVNQLVIAFRNVTGQEPPAPDFEEDDTK